MICLEGVSKKYGAVIALSRFTLQINDHEILVVVGPSGCGKTTCLRLIVGFEFPNEGKVIIDGTEASTPVQMLSPDRRGVSMIFQDLALWPHMTVIEHVEFVLKSRRLTKAERNHQAEFLLHMSSLEGFSKRYPHELSGGERQRLAVARAIASHPKHLLMDEPFSHLDSFLKEELEALILDLKKKLGMTVVYVTHQVQEALRMADRIAVMNQGGLEQIDTKDQILHFPKNEWVKRVLRIG